MGKTAIFSFEDTPPSLFPSVKPWRSHVGDGSAPRWEESGPQIPLKAAPEHLITLWSGQEITFKS